MTAGQKLTLTTRELHTDDFKLLSHLPENPLAFIRGGDGIVGWGEAVRLESNLSAGRVADLAAQWRTLVAAAEVTDEVQLPGTGLVAFGTFAFSDLSKAASTLIVPQVILGSRDGRVWLTTVSGAAAPDFWTHSAEYKTNAAINFETGEISAEKFKELVSSAVEKINSGTLAKVVLARDVIAKLPEKFDVRSVLQKLAHQYPTCWVYSVDGMFGASPELLVRVSHAQVSARVLAGTAGRGTDPGVDQAIAVALAASSKNTAEHAFAVDSLVKSLAPFCTHVDADPTPFSLALPNVWHLASDVHGVLREDASVLDVAAALHPTAAVAGTPTDVAQNLIAKLEGSDRGRYAGPVGWIGADGDGEWAIGLRGAQITDKTIRAFAGCGIVAESEPEAELAETDLKFRPIREALA
ncbi:isochorismate synthase [Rhodoluna lacicola]|jgi:menaquinone-specific isochorismate synthase|uniref:isochorismate synthase n=1 Tax=Rhodoluna lacicola TaxID=529884 RepID=UPI00222F7AD5|nr:chorismate-binding protein [Rhodoluna lacicola]BDS49941.1 isochorismate synthase [Rhodoluna lacicola]